MIVQMFSSNIVSHMFGKNASELYFWIIFFGIIFVNTVAIAYATKQDNIFHDAIYFDKYREKTTSKLAELGYGSGVLTKIDMDNRENK